MIKANTKPIKSGKKLTFENLRTVVTKKEGGILPNKYFEILNRKASKDLEANHILNTEDFI